MIGFTFYEKIGGKKHILRGRKLKERLNQKYPLIKSEDSPFSAHVTKTLISIRLLFRIVHKVHISLFKRC